MFLSPDEDSHYDYAITLRTAGRFLHPAENLLGRDTHPSVEYLVAATRARQLRIDPNTRVDPGYGTPAYFRALDAHAPAVDEQRFRDGPISPAPYIARLYPAGYYSLAALAIGAAGDSVVRQYFFVRFLSVALLPITLLFTWLTLRELGLGERRSLLLLAAVAFLPMTAWMAGSVQPDNLVGALAAATIYFALRLRRDPRNLRTYAILGLLLAAVIATKRHYFVALLLPITALAATRLARPFDARISLAAGVLLLVPAALAFAVTEQALRATPGASGVCIFGPGGVHDGVIERVASGLQSAASNTFSNSLGLRSFWNSFSAYRNAYIDIGSRQVTEVVLAVVPGLTIFVAVLCVVRLGTNGARLWQVARRRSPLCAAQLATSNVLINAYLCFFAILWGFEAYTGGHVEIQGRYWLPFLAAVWLLAAEVAPRALPRYRFALSTTIIALILAYEVTATAFAFPSIHDRFYGPPRVEPKAEISAYLLPAQPGGHSLGIAQRGNPFEISGIAIDLRSASGAAAVDLVIDGKTRVPARMIDRPEVACDAEKTLLHSGFKAAVDTSALAPGRHSAAVEVRVPWSVAPIQTDARAGFQVR